MSKMGNELIRQEERHEVGLQKAFDVLINMHEKHMKKIERLEKIVVGLYDSQRLNGFDPETTFLIEELAKELKGE